MDEKTIQTYNLLAKKYDDETIDFWDKFPQNVLDKFVNHAKGRILDVGSGPGRDAIIIQNKGLEVICLDASEAMIKLCKEKGLKAILGDFNKIPFKKKSFDGVWAYTSLLHIQKSEVSQSLQEIKRVLKNEGILGLGLIEGETEEFKESSGVNMPRWFSFYTKREIEVLLEKNGFEVVYFESFKPKTKNYLNFIAKKI